ncbi:MAG: hypothetical protein KDI09_12575, partial [Halioglobus sp.]|nr:hypothetical protein [Halioglobus sp.]
MKFFKRKKKALAEEAAPAADAIDELATGLPDADNESSATASSAGTEAPHSPTAAAGEDLVPASAPLPATHVAAEPIVEQAATAQATAEQAVAEPANAEP